MTLRALCVCARLQKGSRLMGDKRIAHGKRVTSRLQKDWLENVQMLFNQEGFFLCGTEQTIEEYKRNDKGEGAGGNTRSKRTQSELERGDLRSCHWILGRNQLKKREGKTQPHA